MADETLLVPGTQATKLVDGRGRIVFNAVRVAIGLQTHELADYPPDTWQALLSMEHRPGDWKPVRTSLESNATLEPGTVVKTPYSQLSKRSGPFPYDWRADLRWNALRLKDHIKRFKPSNGRWNLIGHSQGGLLIVLASKLMGGPDEFSRHVARVVLVGVPLAGTVRAAEALLFGRTDMGNDHAGIVRAFARTWPALFQMLPSWDSIVDPAGNPLPSDQQLTMPDGWPAETDVDNVADDMLARARETQALLTGPFSHMGPNVATLVLMGNEQPTPVTLVRDGDSIEQLSSMPDAQRSAHMQKGDTLVPAEQTLSWGGTGLSSARVILIDGSVNSHSMLCEDDDVLSYIQAFLRTAAPQPPVRPIIV